MRRTDFFAAILCATVLCVTAYAQAPAVKPENFQYQRSVSASGLISCAVLDAATYTHAAPGLKDVRLYRGQTEVPYAITLSQTTETSEPARVMNLGMRDGHIVFDLEMPQRMYSEVMLDLSGTDFIAAADVSGMQSADGKQTRITRATLFDLSSQHLGRSMRVQLGEVSFPLLHIELNVRAADGGSAAGFTAAIVRGAAVLPDREEQTVFSSVAQAEQITQRGHETIAVFHLPLDVPVERVSFALAKDSAQSFSRDVEVRAWADGQSAKDAETITGTISQVRVPGSSTWVRELSIPATLGANLQRAATVEVAIENGDDAPVRLTGVALEMRQRKLCFEGSDATMMYGDAALHSPVYDFARLFHGGQTGIATLGSEQKNPNFTPRADERPYTERHPELLWVVLSLVVCLLGVVALRSIRAQTARY